MSAEPWLCSWLAPDGIVPAGTNNIVTDEPSAAGSTLAADEFSYADAAAGEEVTVETDTDDTFIVDGTTASSGVFFLAIDIGDLVSVSGTTYSLTNVDAEDEYLSGVIDNPDTGANTFDIVEPITGTPLNEIDYSVVTFTLFEADGAAKSESAFEDDIQAGDTVSVVGDGDAADDLRTISLTNVEIVGEIGDIVVTGAAPVTEVEFTVAPFAQVFAVSTADDVVIDGDLIDDADELEEWADNATDCDVVTLSYEGDLLDLEQRLGNPVDDHHITQRFHSCCARF